jgi:tetratricopeptide (TPR) repeat protein
MKRRHVSCFPRVLILWSLAGLLGCSSLPDHPVPESEAGRTAALHQAAGSKHFQAGRFAKAGAFYERALAHHASVDDQPGVVRALTALGRCRLAQGQVDQAERHFQAALAAARRLPHTDLKAGVMAGLGEAALHRGDPGTARTWFETGLDLPLDRESVQRAILLHNLGAACWDLGDLDRAAELFQQALAMNSALHNPLGVAANCHSLALLEAEKGNLDRARQLARRALTNDKKAEYPPGIAQDLELLGSLAHRAGDAQTGDDYRRRAALVRSTFDQPARRDPPVDD